MRRLALSLLLAGSLVASASAGNATRAGEIAPEFRLKTLTGDIVMLSELRGKILVIHFAASW